MNQQPNVAGSTCSYTPSLGSNADTATTPLEKVASLLAGELHPTERMEIESLLTLMEDAGLVDAEEALASVHPVMACRVCGQEYRNHSEHPKGDKSYQEPSHSLCEARVLARFVLKRQVRARRSKVAA